MVLPGIASRTIAASTALALALLGSLFAGRPAAAAAGADEPDVETSAAYTYRVAPEAGAVQVTIEFDFTADKPDRRTSEGIFEYFFEGTFLAVPSEAENLTVSDRGGRSLSFTAEETVEGITELEIDFGRNLFYRQTANLVITFDLPAGAARSERPSRINAAYAGFVIWLDPRMEEATVTVVTPAGFEDETLAAQSFELTTADDEHRWVATDVEPDEFWVIASLRRDGELVSTDVEVDGTEVDVLAWPGDATWTEHIVDAVEDGLPTLIDEVGLEWPVDGELTIVESYSPYLSGYAGWYDPNEEVIEVGDELDAHLVFHELGHVWFNDDLFPERWITEGLADEFGAEVVEELGGERPGPGRAARSDPAAQPLNEWRDFESDRETDAWGYPASWTVTRGIVDVVGIDSLAAAVRAAAENDIAYLGDAEPETGPPAADWRVYLDLIENRGEVDGDEVTELFRTWVLTDDDQPLLDDRAASRAGYAELEAAGGAWAPPLAVRTAMASWRFDDADTLIDRATAILADRDATVELLVPLDASLPAAVEQVYEAARGDLDEAAETMAATATAAGAIRATGDGIDGADGVLERVGAIGSDHPARFDDAVDAFEAGDLDGAIDQAQDIDRRVADLRTDGIIRVAATVAAVVLLLAVTVWLVRRRRRRRRRSGRQPPSQPGSTAEPTVPAGRPAIDPVAAD